MGTTETFTDGEALSHAWSETYSKNASHHWHECENSDCPVKEDSQKDGYGEHSYTVKTVSAATRKTEADCIQAAEYYYSCICGEVSTTETFTDGEALSHAWSETYSKNDSHHWHECENSDCPVSADSLKGDYAAHSYTVKTVSAATLKAEADCIQGTTYYYSCICGAISTAEEDTFTVGEALSHAWSETYSKNDSHHWHECKNSDCPVSEDSLKGDYAAHSYTEKVVSADTLKAEADCAQGTTYYYSCICGAISTAEEDTFTVGEALGHAWSETYSKNDSHHWHECENSDCPVSEDSLKGDYAAHSYTEKVVSEATLKAEADCAQGTTYYYSCICGAISTSEEDTFTVGEALGHVWGDWKSISDSQYQRGCTHDPSHSQTVTLSAIGDITLNLSPKVGAVLNPEVPFIGIGAVEEVAASAGAETADASQETKAGEAEETKETTILADFLTRQGWQLKPLNGDWEEVKMPLTLEEKHMGGSLRYTLKGDWGEKHSREVTLNPEGLWITGIEPLTYTGSKVIQSFQLYDGDTLLTEKVDYTLSYKNNQKAYELEGSPAQSGTSASAQGSSLAQGDDLAQAGSLAQSGASSSAYGEGTSSSAIAIVSEGGEALSLMSEGNGVSVTDVSRYNTRTAPRVVVKMKGNYKGTYTIYFPIEKNRPQ